MLIGNGNHDPSARPTSAKTALANKVENHGQVCSNRDLKGGLLAPIY